MAHIPSPAVFTWLLLVSGFAAAAATPPGADGSIAIDGNAVGLTYDGHGGLSAGASSRFLWDYPEPQQQDILDLLFKPGFAASLHMLKVEIGGDTQSTDGTEPSHMHSREDLSCTRGYEMWLMKEAKRRNPSIKTYGLSWGVPYWIGNGSFFSADNIHYQVQWVTCVKETLGFDVDFLGIWNERSWGTTDYVVELRAGLDAAGFNATRIVIPDGGGPTEILSVAEGNSTFANAIDVVGLHYPCNQPCEGIITSIHKKYGGRAYEKMPTVGRDKCIYPCRYWASEDWWSDPNWAGAGCWGRRMNMNYIINNMTSNIAWSPLWAVYADLPYQQAGLMAAMQPWSGNYAVSQPLWTSAQWCQFTQPGWRYLTVESGSSGLLPLGGSYVSLVAADGSGHFTIVLETLLGACNHCGNEVVTGAAQDVWITLTGGLSAPNDTLYCWQTNATNYFVQLAPITVNANGSFLLSIGDDTMITVSTIGNASHGKPTSTIPDPAAFPFPYADNFNGYEYDALAKYFADQSGSFAVRNGTLTQVVMADPGPNGWIANTHPFTIIGDVTGETWVNYSLSATAWLQPNDAGVGLEWNYASLSPCADMSSQLWELNSPASEYLSNGIGAAQTCLNVLGCESSVIYYDCVTSGGTCCGPDCYANLQWAFNANGTVTSVLDGECLMVTANESLVMAPCGSAGNQSWEVQQNSYLKLQGTNLCLTAPATDVVTMLQFCGRVAHVSTFDLQYTPEGYCIEVHANGTWFGRESTTILATGLLTGYNATIHHRFELSMQGGQIVGLLDGVALFNASSTTFPYGMATLGSGYHPAFFDNFTVS